jgi:hypothetical protein
VGEDFVRAVADENVLHSDAVILADRKLELLGVRVGVELERFVRGGADRIQRARRRPVRVFVGVEFHQVGEPGLLTRHVGLEALDDIAPETAHGQAGW